eukprot:5341393-Prymnesium_polylepis.1
MRFNKDESTGHVHQYTGITSVRTSGCVPTRRSEHGGPIPLPPHTPLAAEQFGVQAAARPGGLLRAMALA